MELTTAFFIVVRKKSNSVFRINLSLWQSFLDPEAKAEVIAQKMRQTGIKVSQRRADLFCD